MVADRDELALPHPSSIRIPDVCPISRQTVREDTVNSSIHAVGLLLALLGLVMLVVEASRAGDVMLTTGVTIYGATLVLMYAASTIYHATRHVPRKTWLQVVDHGSIFLLIAGTYTPFTFVTLGGGWGWSLFGVVWGLAVVGIAFKAVFGDRFELASTLIYIAMGWVVVVAVRPLFHNLELGGIVWLFVGGVAYTAGTVFYLWERLPFNHAVWHLFVLTGSICHFCAVWYFLVLPS